MELLQQKHGRYNMSLYNSPFSESVYKLGSVYYSMYDDEVPELSPEYELAVNNQLEFLSVDKDSTTLRT